MPVDVVRNHILFATLPSVSMQDPGEIPIQALRVIKELNLVGIRVDDFQQF